MAEQPTNHDMILGELRGQVRELVHGVNGLSQKFDLLSREVIGLGPLATGIAKLESGLKDALERIDTLETEQTRRDTERGVLQAIFKSPAMAWLTGILMAAAAYLKGSGEL